MAGKKKKDKEESIDERISKSYSEVIRKAAERFNQLSKIEQIQDKESQEKSKEKLPQSKDEILTQPPPEPQETEVIKSEPFISDFDLHLFSNGTFYKIYEKFGAQITKRDGVSGVYFTTWAPNALSISIIGEFNGWQEGYNEMTRVNDHGVWSLFIPGLTEGDTYKFSILSGADNKLKRKSDPYAFRTENRPKNAAMVWDINKYEWKDGEWMKKRTHNLTPTLSKGEGETSPTSYKSNVEDVIERELLPSREIDDLPVYERPMSIYEVHLGSWKRNYDNPDFPNEWGYLSYHQLAHEIVEYVKRMGYTHVELLPVMEHPLDISWGYQVTNYYAATSRFGKPEDLMYFIDYCHQNHIGVILDWVPAHFPADEHSLAYFDGKQIYAYDSIQKGVHMDWGTFIFDYGKNEVQNFLIGSALFWLDKYHADGLRVDAVASMLYLDYSRKEGEWEPNIRGGRENLEAINFLKHLNDIVHKYHDGVVMIAEESTSYPGVSHPVEQGGLGFNMKWNMGWMNDILAYFKEDPINRKYHQGKITFSLWYAFSENFILPISHDEVVHGKKTLLEKMPGDNWQKFANLRVFLGFMYGHPGKKLNFMTTDIGQYNEWNSEKGLDREVLDMELNPKLNLYVKDINKLYSQSKALYEVDFDSRGFHWIDFADADNSVLAFLRISKEQDELLLFVFNMTPVMHESYRFGVPKQGYWKEILNSNASDYGGSGVGNMGGKHSNENPHKEWSHSIDITLPPLSMSVFKWEG